MRERLIELLKKKYDHFCDQCGVNKDSHYIENLADYLLANGVVVPPCKVGDVVYQPIITDDTHEPAIWDITISQILNDAYAIGSICKSNSGISFDFDEVGKTVFLTREEAEAKLKEGVQE